MSRLIDMTGWIMSEHGVPDSKLTVIKRVEDRITPNGCVKTQWLCECNCNEHNQIIATSQNIRRGIVKSCGCWLREVSTNIIKRYQYMSAELRSKQNEYVLFDDYGQGMFFNSNDIFLFDLDDFETIKKYCWYKGQHGYALAYIKGTGRNGQRITMHALLGYKYGDHINHNRADNRKSNLRLATAQENARNHSVQSSNTSGIIGVSWKKDKQKWKAYITVNSKQIHCGYFGNKEDAIRARLEAEAKYYGEFAPQQHLFEQYGIK